MLAAEVGGVALVLQLLFDVEVSLLILLTTMAFMVVMWLSPFGVLERVYGYGGLLLMVFIVAAIDLDPQWSDVAAGFKPQWHWSSLYAYFVVGVIAAALVPYEVHFFSSGAVEEGWGPQDLGVNRANAILGFGVGGLLSVGLIVTSAQAFQGIDVNVDSLGSVALGAQVSLGEAGLLLALAGMMFAIGGAVVEVCFAVGYNLAQFCGWEWGKYRTPDGAPRFTLAWLVFLALAFAVIETGVDPVALTEYAVVLSVVALPLTYLPVILIARDRTYMGEDVNGRLAGFLGWLYFAVILVLAVAAVPLLLATNAGGG